MASVASDTYAFDPADFSITVGEKTVLIVKETLIRLRTADADQVICADAIPAGPGKVKVHYYEATDGNGNPVSVASKVRLGEGGSDDWYDQSGSWPGDGNGSAFGGGSGLY
jgi:hypothetical protein